MVAPWAEFISSLPREEIRASLDEIRNPFEIGFHGIKNGFNFSASMRTGHSFLCAGYHKIEITQTYDKAAMTAKRFDNHLVQDWKTSKDFIEGTKGRNVVALECGWGIQSKDLRDFEWPEKPIMIFGSEGDGLPADLLDAATAVVRIPLDGLVHSLNVACACSISIYDWHLKFSNKKFSGKK